LVEYISILVKAHESATNTFFRFDFDETKIKVWTEDSNAMTTRTNSYIPNGNRLQPYHNYSYSDLFSDGAEKTFYVQALEAGKHNIDVVYVLDGQELWTETAQGGRAACRQAPHRQGNPKRLTTNHANLQESSIKKRVLSFIALTAVVDSSLSPVGWFLRQF